MSQRLGIAAALLGDPPVLLFDEPVNGLDPEGIRWVRTLMRTLAAEGRTVFVSSHLLAEMANTADRLVVIGKGKLIASTTVAEFVGRSGADTVRVRSPQLDTLRRVLTDAGLTTEADHGSALLVRGAAIEVIGDLAARNAITLHELTAQRASLEEAYMKLTDEATEYRAVRPVSAVAVLRTPSGSSCRRLGRCCGSAAAVAVLSVGLAALQGVDGIRCGAAAAGEGGDRRGGVRRAGADGARSDDGDGRIPQRHDPHDVHGHSRIAPWCWWRKRLSRHCFPLCTRPL